ncbi:MAG: rhodanese-like domain-containing protein [Mariprofundaceae bacterium]
MSFEKMTVNQLYPRWLAAYANDRPCCLVDVRQAAEYTKRHIPMAILKPLGQLNNNTHDLTKSANIYLICHSGIRSRQAAKILYKQGFERLINIEGGIEEWLKMGYPVHKEEI